MGDNQQNRALGRRSLLKAGLAAGGGLAAAAAGARAASATDARPDPLITEIQEWNR